MSDMVKYKAALLSFLKLTALVFSGLELVRVPRVPGTRGIFGQYWPAPAGFANFTTYRCVSPLKFEDLLVIGTRFFKFPTQAL